MKDPIERQDAIDAICKACSMEEDYHKCDGYPKTSTWCDNLVALRALPSAQPDVPDINDGDMISRQAAIDAVNNAFDRETLLTGFVRSIAVRAIRDMPSAQPEQITCKDCNHCTFSTGAEIYCDELDMRMYQWDYCSRAERREDE